MKRSIITLCCAFNRVLKLFGFKYSICQSVHVHDYLNHQASQLEIMDFEAVKPVMFIR